MSNDVDLIVVPHFGFLSTSTEISAAQLQAAFDSLYANSTTFATKVAEIISNNGNVLIQIAATGGVHGVDTGNAEATYDFNSQIVIPADSFNGDYYDTTSSGTVLFSLERLLAHEIFHAWWDVTDGQVGDYPYSGDEATFPTSKPNEEAAALAFENTVRSEQLDALSLPSEPDREDHGDGEEDDSLGTHNTDAFDPDDPTPPPAPDMLKPLWPVQNPDGFPPKSPLVLDVDHSGTIELSSLGDTGTYFDLDGDGQAELTAWITGGDGLLARDVNENGNIDDISELFGSSGGAEDGFASLRLLDSNADNAITSADTDWAELAVWTDDNMDGRTQDGELHTLDDLGIVSIALNAALLANTYNNGSQITHSATFTTDEEETYSIVDAWFDHNPGMTRNVADYDFDLRAAFLPTLRGFGEMKDLHIAASIDNGSTDTVMSMLIDLTDQIAGYADPGEVFANWDDIEASVDALMLKWAGVEEVDPESRGTQVDARHLEFYEEFTGKDFTQYGKPNPRTEAGAWIEAMYSYIKTYFTSQIVAQVIGADVFDEQPAYSLFTAGMSGDMDLSSSALDAVETAALGAADPYEAWKNFAYFIGYTKGFANLTGGETAALDSAIGDSDVDGIDDWADLVAALNTAHDGIVDSPDDWPNFHPLGYGTEYGTPINGTSGADTLTGANGVHDQISGNGGNDTISGLSGNDTLSGGAGDDSISGGSGNDVIDGGTENDTIDGGDGDDRITGGNGNDTMDGGAGDDYLIGGSGNDIYIYEDGLETYSDSAGTDEIRIASSTMLTTADIAAIYCDVLGNLTIEFDEDNAITIDDYADVHSLFGQLRFFPGESDVIELLTFQYDSSSVDLTSLSTLTINGGTGSDTIILDEAELEADYTIYGFGGNDQLAGNAGNDELYGGSGADVLIGNLGDDHLDGGTGDDDLRGNEGADIIYGDEGNDSIVGGIYNQDDPDQLYGQSGNDILTGGGGADILDGGDGDDVMYGDWNQQNEGDVPEISSNDTYYASAGFDQILEGGGTLDLIVFPEGVEFGDLTVDRTQWDLTIAWDGNLTTVVGYFRQVTEENVFLNGIEELHFADETVIDLTEIISPYDQILTGGTDYDAYLWDGGVDTIADAGGEYDQVYSDFDPHLLVPTIDGDDLVINVLDASDQLTIYDQFEVSGEGRIEFVGTASTGFAFSSATAFVLGTNSAGSGDTLTGDVSGAADDIIFSYAGNDVIDAGDGFDSVFAGDGDDIVHGDDDEDEIAGGEGSDSLYGDNGADAVLGEEGDDSIEGGAGDDYLDGGEGADVLEGGDGNDLIDGGSGNDVVSDGAGDDYLVGGDGVDEFIIAADAGSADSIDDFDVAHETIDLRAFGSFAEFADISSSISQVGSDTEIDLGDGQTLVLLGVTASALASENFIFGEAVIEGTSGSDTLTGTSGDDTILGYAGNDTLSGLAGDDTLDGGDGTDTADYGSAAAGVTVSLATGAASNDGDGGSDTLTAIENVLGSAYADTLTGSSGANSISGGDGDDTLIGGAGNDTLDGGNGTDAADYSADSAGVTVNLATGAATDGSGGTDTLSNIENVTGSAYNDTITGSSSANTLSGGAGNDTLQGGAANDTLDGGSGTDTVSFSGAASAVTVNLSTGSATGDGTDTLTSIENVIGSANNDTITGSSGDNVINGGSAGNDTITGGDGNDTYVYTGGSGTDTFAGENGTDTADFSGFGSAVWVDITNANDAQTRDNVDLSSGTWRTIAQLTTVENVIGTAYADEIYGDSSANVLKGGGGNDIIQGRGGNDEYQYDLGDGQDTLTDTSGTEVIRFGAGITVSDLSFAYVGSPADDLQISITGGGKITIADHNKTTSATPVEKIIFADNSELYLAKTETGTSGNDTMNGTVGQDTLSGGDGNDTINSSWGIDTLSGGNGDDSYVYTGDTTGTDTFDGGAGTDTANFSGFGSAVWIDITNSNDAQTRDNTNLSSGTWRTIAQLTAVENVVGSAYADEIYGDSGANVLKGGGGNDIIQGRGGNDEYIFSAGDGQDTLTDTSGSEIIRFGAGITVSDLSFAYVGSPADDLEITIGVGGDKITIADHNKTTSATPVEKIVFNDNSELYLAKTETGTSGNDTMSGTVGQDTLNGGDGNDTFNPSWGIDTLNGGNGDDTYLYTGDIYGTDVFDGGAGTDTGDFSGFAHAIWVNLNSANNDAQTRDDSDLSTGTWRNVATFSNVENVIGSAYSDQLIGDGGDNVLTGGAGNDTLTGNAGNDTYVYSAGLDNITDTGGTDTLWITGGATINDISVSNYGTDEAKVVLNSGTDEVIVYDLRNGSASKHVETIKFDDGFSADLPSYNSWLLGTSGNDNVSGNGSGNILIGYAGNDTINSGGGADAAHGGSGNDTIHGDDGADLLHGGAGNDVLYGDDGLDTLYGGSGADTFMLEATEAFNNIDVIKDFNVANDNDVLDISDILDATSYNHGVDLITDWVEITTSGSDSIVKIDRDGTGGTYSMTQVATLQGITGLTDEAALVSSGNLLAA